MNSRATALRVLRLLVLLALPLVAIQVPFLRRALIQLVEYLAAAGPSGMPYYALSYVVLGLLCAPGALMAALAGYVYGFGLGVLIAWPTMIAVSMLVLGFARLVLGGFLARRAEGSPFWRALRQAVDLHGLRVAILLRLTPMMPQNFLAYFLAPTPLRYRHLALATATAGAPMLLMQVYLGSLLKSAAAIVDGSAEVGSLRLVALALGLLATAIVLYSMARVAKRELAAILRTATSDR